MPLTHYFAAALAAALVAVAPQAALAKGNFFASAQQSSSAAIAADPSGGLHASFTGYDGPTGDTVTYRYCAASCESASHWGSVTLAVTDPVNVQIATTPDGHPRLLITSRISSSGASRQYNYAACNSSCLDPKNWTIVPVANSAEGTFADLFEYRIPEHSFALDDRGSPYFIYVDTNYGAEPDHYGTFLTSCADDCIDPENWTEINVAVQLPERYTTELWDEPVLAVAPGGKLRVLAKVYALDTEGNPLKDGLYYYECNDRCTENANWRRARVLDTGYGSYPNPTWDLAVLPDGRPRAVLFAGSDMEQTDLDHKLIYMWCDAGCGDEKNWYGHAVTAKEDGESPDLALTADGNPRIAFLGQYGDLGTLTCDTMCESDDGKWDLTLVDAAQEAATDRPTALPFTCDGELWNGMMPRLALADGRSWFAYDLVDSGRCLYKENDSDPVTYAEFHELWRGSRLAWLD